MPKIVLPCWFWVTRLSWSACLRAPKRKTGQGNGMDSFIADVGGYMGLLLGISLLSIYRAVEHSTRKLVGRTRQGKSMIDT